jgi:beta-lactamase class A
MRFVLPRRPPAGAGAGTVDSVPMIAYVARELGTGRTLSAHDDVQLPAYSTIKVLLAAAFWRMVARGELDEAREYRFEPGDCVGGAGVLRGLRHAATLSLADVLHLALVVSDNDAANVVASVVGFEHVNALAEELGLTRTRMKRFMMDQEAVAAGRENSTSAGDLARLLEELAAGEALERLVGERVLASLELQEHLDGIARYLPAEACYAGKCGDDWPVGRYAHDCALVTTGDRRAVLVVMTRDSGGFETVARTGAALYSALGEGRASI